jgi:hypothetical protein
LVSLRLPVPSKDTRVIRLLKQLQRKKTRNKDE